jgi:hypothetical protein
MKPSSSSALAAALCPSLLAFASPTRQAEPQTGAPPAKPAETQTDPRAESTKKMAARLEEIAATTDPTEVFFLSAEHVPNARKRVQRELGTPNELMARMQLAHESVQANLCDECLEQLDKVDELLAKPSRAHDSMDDEMRHLAVMLRSVAWQRIGELENCLSHHCCTSCVVPFDGKAVHTERRGSENAEKVLLEMLKEDPEDLDARWRLNLVAMTLGQWPDGVPKEQLVPPSAFASEHDVGKFSEVAHDCGMDPTTLSGGVVTEDFDGDGFVDVLTSSIGMRDRMYLWRNNGDGTFTERSHDAGLDGEVGGLNMIHADYDNDGDADVLVLRGAWFGEAGQIPNSLLRNDGHGNFEDVTVAAGLYSEHPTQAGVFADLDGDGWLDLYIGNETQRRDKPHPCELWLSNRDGTFTNVAADVGAATTGFVKAVVAGDYDNDGRPDLYLSTRQGRNRLLHNESVMAAPNDPTHGLRFKDTSAHAGVDRPMMGFPCFWFDFDNDGWEDLYAASNAGFAKDRVDDICRLYLGKPTVSERPRLYHNEHNGKFVDVAPKMGADRALFSMSANFGDVDNDGWLDFMLGTGSPDLRALLPKKMFRNDGGKKFQDVTSSAGIGNLQKGHGIAFADVDEDGDQDVFQVLGGGYSGDVYPHVFYENPGHGHHWITMRLKGVKANRCAIGARIEVRIDEPGTGERSVFVKVGHGASFGSSSLQAEIGLGDATKIVYAEIRWPGSGTVQRLEKLPLDKIVNVTEGDAAVQVVEPRPFKLGHHKS